MSKMRNCWKHVRKFALFSTFMVVISLRGMDLNPSSEIPEPKHPYLHIPESYLDRFKEILVIGDVHGCYDELQEFLSNNDVDDSTLKIFTGDIIDKGPKSREVLNFVMNSNSSLTVRGNHEDKVIGIYLNKSVSDSHEDYHASVSQENETHEWIRELSPAEIDYLQELPYVIYLDPLNSVVVHAGVVPFRRIDQTQPYFLTHIRGVFFNGTVSITAKSTIPWALLWKGPEHVYFGHDEVRGIQMFDFATGVDGGLVHGGNLTGIFVSGPRNGSVISYEARQMYVDKGTMTVIKQNREMRDRRAQAEEEQRQRESEF